jgi:hypothetical protein
MAGTMMEAEDWGQEVSWPPRGHENWESSQETYLYADHDVRFLGPGQPAGVTVPMPFLSHHICLTRPLTKDAHRFHTDSCLGHTVLLRH